jgi:predicted transcriptional regulator
MSKQPRHRSRSEIISTILQVANGNRVTITEIQFKTHLTSYTILKQYLDLLLQNDLIEYTKGGRTFKTTPKGMQALQIYNEMDELFVTKSKSMNNIVELSWI